MRCGGGGGQARGHGQHAGSAEVRPDPAEADRGLGGRLEAGRHPHRSDRRHGDADAAGGGRRQGIKIVLVDTTLKDPSIAASAIASDNEGGGKAAFEAIKQLNPKGGKVMVMSTDPGVSTVDARVKGFEEAVKADPKFTYVGVQYSHNDPATAAQLISAALQKDPDMVGIFAANLFAAEGSATGLRQAGKQGSVDIVGFDAGPNQVKALKEGTVQALVAQQPEIIGQYGVDAAVSTLDGVAGSQGPDGLHRDHQGQRRRRRSQGDLQVHVLTFTGGGRPIVGPHSNFWPLLSALPGGRGRRAH